MKADNNNNDSNHNNETKNAPFFARKQAGKPLVIKTRIKAGAGAAEEVVK